MTALYVYAITDRLDGAMPERSGFGGAPLVSLPYQDIAAVVSPLEVTQMPASSLNVRHHEEIVEALMAIGTVLPVRFGTFLPDEIRAQHLLAAHYPSFATTLERVRGRVELGLRVLWPNDSGPTGAVSCSGEERHSLRSSGRQYLMACLEEERRAQARRQIAHRLAEGIHRPLAGMAVESTLEVLPTPRMLLAAAYLVDRHRKDSMRAALKALASTFTGLQFLLTGPWPPYHFVTQCVPAMMVPREGGMRTDAGTEFSRTGRHPAVG